MTTNAELLDLAMGRLGSRKSPAIRAMLVKELNSTMKRLERGPFLPWFLETSAQLIFAAGDLAKALPTGFLREADETRPYITDASTGAFVRYMTKTLSKSAMVGLSPNDVRYYSIDVGNNFRVMAVPTAETRIQVPIYVTEIGKSLYEVADNDTVIFNNWLILAHDWTVYEALTTIAALHLKDKELAGDFSTLALRAKKDLYDYHEARIHQSQDYEVGGISNGS